MLVRVVLFTTVNTIDKQVGRARDCECASRLVRKPIRHAGKLTRFTVMYMS